MKAILTYHSIDSSGSVISVSPETFDRQVRWLASSDVAVVSVPDLLRLPRDRDAVAITFDDAYTNFQVEAWPRLQGAGLTATLFVPTAFVGRSNGWPELPGGSMPRLPILDWPALARLREDGVILGAHTRTHPDLRALDPAAVADEIQGSFDDLLRETGQPADAFAYPYGFWSPRVAAAVRSACGCACTTELRPVEEGEDAHLLPRLDTFYLDGPARIENFGTWTFREYLRLRLHLRTLARRVRGAARA